MRLAEDRRARVPFAIVAALLLVASATLAVTVRERATEPPDPDTPAAVDRATASTESSVAAAVDRAASRAARDPVIEPANTTYGRLIDPETPFRDSLRMRIYLAAIENVGLVNERVDAARATASLPGVQNASTLRRGMDRVSLREVNGSLRVRIEGVRITVRRDGRVVERTRRDVTVTVDTPVLSLHDRTERYDQRLDRGPLEGPGLGRFLTAYLYAMTWTRGYLQYGGFPIANVLPNRHLELLTNAGLLGYQRSTFGTVDPEGRAAMTRAAAQVTAYDLAAAMDESDRFDTRSRVTPIMEARPDQTDPDPLDELPARSSPGPDDRQEVTVDRVADEAFVDVVVGSSRSGLDRFVRRTYASRARVVSHVELVEEGQQPGAIPPGVGEWRLVGEDVDTTTTVTTGPATLPDPRDGWHRHAQYRRHVMRTHEVTYTWERDGETTETRRTWTDTYRVGLALEDRYPPHGGIPDGPIDHRHVPGGPLSGKNLADTPTEMHDRLVTGRGGVDDLARRAVEGETRTEPVTVTGRTPDGLRNWVYDDLAGLRERIRNVSTNVSHGEMATGTSPAWYLALALQNRSDSLVDAPDRYRSVADKVRVAARAEYLQQVIALLRARAFDDRETAEGIGRALEDVANVSLASVRRAMEGRSARIDRGSVPGPDGPVAVSVDGAPTYLALTTVDHDRVPAVDPGGEFRPLTARNVNLFTVPYGDVADVAVGAAAGNSGSVRLRTAAMALRNANRTLERRPNPALERRRDRLQVALSNSLRLVRNDAEGAVVNGTRLDLGRSERVVSTGMNRWNTTHARALAVVNGSAATAIAAAAHERPVVDARAADEAEVRVAIAFQEARIEENRQVDLATVAPVGEKLRKVGIAGTKKVFENQLADASRQEIQDRLADSEWVERNLGDEDLSSVPAGLPLAPVPGYWYATINL